ncbi:hypothetical protein F5Y14DRAFT_447300 [Nemania sp. NC0429]|nr:hypothetical protein F5Y14DRAFT_447300 [Nemania sp. NC0429]
MAKKVKSRMISVRLISMAMTGFFYQYARPRDARPMSMLKYDPVGTSTPGLPPTSDLFAPLLLVQLPVFLRKKVLFLEKKRKGR